MAKNEISYILRSKNTVFTFKDILLAFQKADSRLLKRRLNYYVKKGDLYSIRRGLYAKDKNYNKNELATKIYTPSYISFETILTAAGIVFQYYSQIFVATYQTKEIECDEQKYSFRKIKNEILVNRAGVELKENYSLASPERAFLDVLYLNKTYYFDNLSPLNWDKIYEILPVYCNKRMEKIVKKLQKDFLKKL